MAKPTILDRYIARELVGPFLFGVAAFVSLFVAGNFLLEVAQVMAKHGVGPGTVLLLFLYWLPKYLVLTFPMSMLLAVLLAFGRLSGESEITAMRAGGAPFPRLVVPVVAVGLLVSLITIAFNEQVTPRATRAYGRLERQVVRRLTPYQHFYTRSLKDDRLEALIYARGFDPARGVLTGVTYVRAYQGRPLVTFYGEYAKWDQQRNDWFFYQGWMSWPKPVPGTVYFSDQPMEVKLGKSPAEIEQLEMKAEDMTWGQLRQHIRRLQAQKLEVAELQTRWHHKLSIPFACLIFALIGAPLGLRSHRGSSSFGLGLSIIIAFCYYVVWEYLGIVAERGMISPFVAAWAPNVLGAAVGAVLIWRAAR